MSFLISLALFLLVPTFKFLVVLKGTPNANKISLRSLSCNAVKNILSFPFDNFIPAALAKASYSARAFSSSIVAGRTDSLNAISALPLLREIFVKILLNPGKDPLISLPARSTFACQSCI